MNFKKFVGCRFDFAVELELEGPDFFFLFFEECGVIGHPFELVHSNFFDGSSVNGEAGGCFKVFDLGVVKKKKKVYKKN